MSTHDAVYGEWLGTEAGTLGLGARLAAALSETPMLVALEGELGAGKTTLVRGFLRALGHEGKVVSPTYTLMESYEAGGFHVIHLDLYRINHPEEIEYLGLRDRIDDAVVLVEWPARGQGWLPGADLAVHLAAQGEGRMAQVQARSRRGRALLNSLATPASPNHSR